MHARVSTLVQEMALQLDDALRTAGCDRIFEDRASGAVTDRPGLAQAIAFVREGDVLVTWKLDRLARSLPHLIKGLTVREAASRLKIGKTALYDALAQKTRLPKEDKA